MCKLNIGHMLSNQVTKAMVKLAAIWGLAMLVMEDVIQWPFAYRMEQLDWSNAIADKDLLVMESVLWDVLQDLLEDLCWHVAHVQHVNKQLSFFRNVNKRL